ncbi:hypothetical protein [Pseudonocardia sp. T1-2H]|uniref:hypothetical protein n=1 Tax=Pseudonocardia sp. T1-2H TaxID=3128899 RepID=UPI0031015B99
MAGRLYLDPSDVAYTLSEHLAVDLHDEEIPEQVWKELRDILDPHGERTDIDTWFPCPHTGRTDGGLIIG